MQHPELLIAAGLLAGAMNSVAGGGSFVSLPALILSGVPSTAANMTSTLALFPASFASAVAYRNDFQPFGRVPLPVLLAITLAGSVVGALLLTFTTSRAFDILVPWLLLIGTLAFGFGRQFGGWLRARWTIGTFGVVAMQLLLGIYAGYFGGAVGIMMMACWMLLGTQNLNAMNAAKSVIVGSANALAVVIFVIAGGIYWAEAATMLVAALVGGYFGARFARNIDERKLRPLITILNCAITAAFFWRTFAQP